MPELPLPIAFGRVRDLLVQAEESKGPAERRFRIDALARGLRLADPGTVDDEIRRRAERLRIDPAIMESTRTERAPHAVSVPLILLERGGGRAFVRQFLVVYDPLGLRPGLRLSEEAAAAIDEALRAGIGLAGPGRDPNHFRLVAAQPAALARWRLEGDSMAAGAYCSAAALVSGRKVRPSVGVTGAFAAEKLSEVGHLEQKIAAAIEHGLEALVVPRANRSATTDSSVLRIRAIDDRPALIDAVLSPAPGRRLRPQSQVAAVRELFGTGWRGYRWPTIRERIAEVLSAVPEARLDLRVELLSRLAATQRHLGDPVGSQGLLETARSIAQSERGREAVPDPPLIYLEQQTAMTQRQLGDFEQAEAAALRAVQRARDARLKGELVKSLGCRGLVAMSQERPDVAIEAYLVALAEGRVFAPERNVRTLAYLIEALGTAGELERASEHYRSAIADLEVLEAEERPAAESWLRTAFAGVMLSGGDARLAAETLDVTCIHRSVAEEPLPGLLARRHLGVAWCQGTTPERGFDTLAASPLAFGSTLAPHLAWMARVNVLHEAHQRLLVGAWDADISGRARAALARFPEYARAFCQPTLSEVRDALGSPNPERAYPPLIALLGCCRRLS